MNALGMHTSALGTRMSGLGTRQERVGTRMSAFAFCLSREDHDGPMRKRVHHD